MYWYISFLRPPPISAEAGSSITITPQVANDLRTEIRYEPTELYYFWRLDELRNHDTPPAHLTTFTPPESTYRPLSIPLPAQAAIGSRWRLCLFTTETSPPAGHAPGPGLQDILALTAAGGGCLPLSVFSEGIEIVRPNPAAPEGVTKGIGSSSKGKAKDRDDRGRRSKKGKEKDEGVKQSRIRRSWRMPRGGFLTVVEQTSFDLDKKVWDSGLALSSWLYRHIHAEIEGEQPSRNSTKTYKGDILDSTLKKPLNILELGSGTGIVSIALCSILSSGNHGRERGRIVATDLESAIELMQENMSLNPCIQRSGSGVAAGPDSMLSAKVLDWDQPLPAWVEQVDGEGKSTWPSLIIAADVTYNTASFPSLLRTLIALLLPRDRMERPRLLLAYKQRDLGERELWAMLEKEGVKLEMVDTVAGAEGSEGAVEIWVSTDSS